jgi:hypothetical protein
MQDTSPQLSLDVDGELRHPCRDFVLIAEFHQDADELVRPVEKRDKCPMTRKVISEHTRPGLDSPEHHQGIHYLFGIEEHENSHMPIFWTYLCGSGSYPSHQM